MSTSLPGRVMSGLALPTYARISPERTSITIAARSWIPVMENSRFHWSATASTCLWRWMSTVVLTLCPGVSLQWYSVRCLASWGRGRGSSGSGSSRASSKSRSSRYPLLWRVVSRRLRFSSRRFLFLPGWMSEGEFGRTAKVAASAQDNSAGGRPKYLQEAASSPTTLPPKGAWEA